MGYKLIFPITSNNIYEADNPTDAVKLCFKDIPKTITVTKITIINILNNETYTFRVHKHNTIDNLKRIEMKIDKLIELHKKDKNPIITNPGILKLI